MGTVVPTPYPRLYLQVVLPRLLQKAIPVRVRPVAPWSSVRVRTEAPVGL